MSNPNIMSFVADGAITEYAIVSMTYAGKVSVTSLIFADSDVITTQTT